MRKALRNIPKPDEDKLAIFYGRDKKKKAEEHKKEPEKATVAKMSTVDKKTTADKLPTVVNEDLLRDKLRSILSPAQQLIYMNLFKRSIALGQDVTGWVGYGELSNETKASLKTVQRAIGVITKRNLVKKVDFVNTAARKGSKYQVFYLLE